MVNVEWILIAVGGLLAGLGLGFWLGRLGPRGASAKAAELEAELDSYKGQVSEHFAQSAAHFQAIGRQYRELYEHMAEGSERLCDASASEAALTFPRPDDVAALSADETVPAEVTDAEAPTDELVATEKPDAPARDYADEEHAASSRLDEQSKPDAGDEAVQSTSSDVETEPGKRLYH